MLSGAEAKSMHNQCVNYHLVVAVARGTSDRAACQ